MYESHFLLSHRPFVAAPSAEAYIPTRSLEQARQTLIRCIDRAEGPGLIVGPAGTGKSLLCQVLAKHFRGRFQVAHLAGARLSTRRALLQSILFELKLPFREMDEGELRLSLIDHLEPRSGGSEGLLLLVDEAHTLPLRLLEEIRLLTNVVRDAQTRVRLVLAGGMALEERLTSPKLESFHQRIAGRCYLQPLGRDETVHYVQEQIRRCGASPDALFTAEAITAVHVATDGIPRLINQVCDHGLMLAALNGRKQLDTDGIEEAWADLQQLPIPLHEPPVLAGGGQGSGGTRGIVEFGQLGELPTVVAGTIGPGLADATVANLDSISRTLEALQVNQPDGMELAAQTLAERANPTAASDFSPAAGAFSAAANRGTEVELIFHGAHDPFGGQWEEEEVVIDRYAHLEDAAIRSRRVTSAEGRALGAAVSAAAGRGTNVEGGRRADESQVPLAISVATDFDPASDPLLPEEAADIAPPRRVAVSLAAVTQDDREIIVVEDQDFPQSATHAPRAPRPTPVQSRTKRPEYRQLFSTLRGK